MCKSHSSETSKIVSLAYLLLLAHPALAQDEVMTIPVKPGSDQAMTVVMPPELAELHRRNMATLQQIGYVTQSDSQRRAELVQGLMAAHRSAAALQGRPDDPGILGYVDINEDFVDYSRLPFYPTFLPPNYIERGSSSYLFPGDRSLKQLHTRTVFGTVLVDEHYAATVNLYVPNLTIRGEPATVTHIQYQGDAWATAVYATSGGRFFIVECDRRLEGQDKARFVGMVGEMLNTMR